MLAGMPHPSLAATRRAQPPAAGRSPAAPALGTLMALVALGALTACGGGGSEGAAPAATATSASPPPPVAAPPAPAVAGSRATCNLPNFQADLLALVNAQRASGASCGSRGSFAAAPLLAWSDPLSQASLVHSDDMMARNFFSHTGSDGRSAGDRATAAGYAWRTWGENIAAGQMSSASVVAAWMASDGHCANIMNESFRDIGLACVSGTAGNTYRSYWTMTLGATR
jgi:uncharacterized protein YkwD